jgi:ABC-type nickel/cobalt efflux system permease component RcnA
MKKFLFIFLLFQTLLLGCAECQLMKPTAHISINIDIDKKTAKNIHIKWTFSEIFSQELLIEYDKNHNKRLDKKELSAVLKTTLDYLIKKNMLTKLEYANKDEISTTLTPKYQNFEITMVENVLVFTYDALINKEIQDKSSLSLTFIDDESNFAFLIADVNLSDSELYHNKNLYLFTASIFFSTTALENKVELTQDVNVTKQEEIKIPQEKVSLQAGILQESIAKIKSLFESIQDEKNPLTYLFLLFFAYIYGVIHALGPGHGKTLVASYFLSNERSYAKALYISAAIGFVHTFSAFLLTLVIYFMVNTFLVQFVNDAVFYTTKISALIIIFIAVYLIYKKYKVYKKIEQMNVAPKYNFSKTPHLSSCGCNSCKVDNNSTDIALIISAGIIPCPGTTTIFIFAISLGLYYAGFVSALVMSLGMSTIIFFSALLSTVVRKKTADKSSILKKYLEYGSLFIILVLGIFLLSA